MRSVRKQIVLRPMGSLPAPRILRYREMVSPWRSRPRRCCCRRQPGRLVGSLAELVRLFCPSGHRAIGGPRRRRRVVAGSLAGLGRSAVAPRRLASRATRSVVLCRAERTPNAGGPLEARGRRRGRRAVGTHRPIPHSTSIPPRLVASGETRGSADAGGGSSTTERRVVQHTFPLTVCQLWELCDGVIRVRYLSVASVASRKRAGHLRELSARCERQEIIGREALDAAGADVSSGRSVARACRCAPAVMARRRPRRPCARPLGGKCGVGIRGGRFRRSVRRSSQSTQHRRGSNSAGQSG